MRTPRPSPSTTSNAGSASEFIADDEEITLQPAADLLNVSRPYLLD